MESDCSSESCIQPVLIPQDQSQCKTKTLIKKPENNKTQTISAHQSSER